MLAAIGFAAALQWEWIPGEWVPWMPGLWGLAGLLGAIAWRIATPVVAPTQTTEPDEVAPLGWRVFAAPPVLLSLATLLLGIYLIRGNDLSRAGTLLWLAGIAAVPLTAFFVESGAVRKRSASSSIWLWRVAGVALVLVALGVRLYRLEEVPAKYLDDEGAVSDWGLSYLHGTPIFGQHMAAALTLFRNGATAYPLLGSVVHALVMQIAGETIFGSRLTAVLAGVLCVAIVYAILVRQTRPWVALVTGLLFAFCHTHLFWSRFGTPQSLTTFAVAAVFWLTLAGMRSGRYSTFLFAGTLLGLAQYFYEGARFFVPVLAVFFVWMAVIDRGFLRNRALHVVAMAGMAALVFAPIGLWYLAYPQELLARSRGVLIFAQPDYIASRYPGLDTWGVVLAQLQRAFEGFAYRGDGANFFSLRGPILDPVARTLLVTGVFAIFALRDRLRLLVFLWVWIPTLIVCIPTVDPPSMTRLIQVVPALYLVGGLVLDRVARLAERAGGTGLSVVVGVAAIAAVGYGIRWDLLEFFVRYPKEHVADAQTVGGESIRRYAGDAQVRVLSGFSYYTPTVRFLARGHVGEDVEESNLPLPGRDVRDSYVLVAGDHKETIDKIRAIYPQAREEDLVNSRGDLLLHSFRIPAAATAAAAGEAAPWRLPDARLAVRGAEVGQIFSPKALALDAKGRLYLADTFNRRLQVFDEDGHALFEFGGPTGETPLPGMPVSLAILDDGSLLVLRREPLGLEHYTADGKRLPDIALAEKLGSPTAVARAPGGFYLADPVTAQVLRFKNDGSLVAKTGSRGPGPGQFDNPLALAAARDGRLFIYDAGNKRIVRLSPDLAYEMEWPLELPTPLGQAIAIGPEGDERVYIAHPGIGAVQRYTIDGKLEWLVGMKGDYPGNLAWPVAVALDEQGNLFLADDNRGQLFRYGLSRLPSLTHQN